MYFILALLIFLTVIFGISGHRHHNHEFILLSYVFGLATVGVASVLFLIVNAFPS